MSSAATAKTEASANDKKAVVPKPTPPPSKETPKGKKVVPTGMTVQFEEITPAVATKMLEHNVSNRNVRDARVAALVRDIETGEFFKTHQGIGFNEHGELVDGQHRLWAVVRSGKTVTMQVTRGIEAGAKPVIDTGAKRTLSDVLSFSGHSNTAHIASVVRMHLLYTRGTPMNSYGYTLSQIEMVNHFEENEKLFVEAGHLAQTWRAHIQASPQVVGTAWLIFSEIDPEDAKQFFEDIVNFQTGGEGDSRLALIRRLRTIAENKEKVSQSMQLSMFVKAWNAWRTGTPMPKMQLDRLRNKKVMEAI